MKAQRRFTEHKPAGRPLILKPDHPAVDGARTLFPKSVGVPHVEERLFKSGHNSRKIGDRVTKGMWKGMPIYTLTLEERATCPKVCEHWRDCFGNKMHWSTRWASGPLLEKNIPIHIAALADKHPKGFVVRLHVLGDFYSSGYVWMWSMLMSQFPQLHVFGYTRRWGEDRGSIKQTIETHLSLMNDYFSTRWRVRFSERGGRMGTKTVDDVTLRGKTPDGIVCPAQTGDADCCGTCGLCWNTDQPIVFLNH